MIQIYITLDLFMLLGGIRAPDSIISFANVMISSGLLTLGWVGKLAL